MVTLKEISPNIFELIESAFGSEIVIIYWNLDKKLISEKRHFPDDIRTRKLTEADLDYFEEFYKPLIIRKNPIN